MFAVIEALLVLLVGTVLIYAAYSLAQARTARPRALEAGRWETAHYASEDATRVVARKVVSGRVLDEHVIAVIAESDPDYDERFLEAMATARARVALFESEA